MSEPLDSLIVGAGPAGLSVSESFVRAGITHRVFERGAVGHHLAQYPTFMRYFSTRDKLELAGFPLQCAEDKPTRAEYVSYLLAFVRDRRLPVETHANVRAVARDADGAFTATIERIDGTVRTIRARSVVVAVGAWEFPVRLNVPGEDLPHVHRRFLEAYLYHGHPVLVVGGSNSAVETSLALFRGGAKVTLIHRGPDFSNPSIKYWLRPDLENRIKFGEIAAHTNARIASIEPGVVHVTVGERTIDIRADFVLPMIGYEPPVDWLRSVGIDLEAGTNKPAHDPQTLESNVPGVYIAGVITSGNIGGKVFIENSRDHGDRIAAALLPKLRR